MLNGLLFPSPAEAPVELYKCQQLVKLRLYQAQFGGEIIGVVGEDLKIACSAAFVPHLGKSGRILRGIHEELLLHSKFLGLAIGNQGVGNITESALNGSLIKKQGLLLLGLRQSDIGPQSACSKDRLGEASTKVPQSRWPRKQTG